MANGVIFHAAVDMAMYIRQKTRLTKSCLATTDDNNKETCQNTCMYIQYSAGRKRENCLFVLHEYCDEKKGLHSTTGRNLRTCT